MKPLIFLPVSVLFLATAGCGKESDELPEDGRDFDGVQYSEQTAYTGRVIDGYLKNARVWLDMDGDGQYTAGPMEYELTSGRTITLASGEPTAMSGEDGKFSLDISELSPGLKVGPDIDPRKFPLFALALPGKTLEQTRSGDDPVPRAFLLSASPGVQFITPLTTLDRYRRLTALPFLPGAGGSALSGLAGVNLLRDYVLAEDDRAHAYARALARFSASQFPDAYNESLSRPESDGTERGLSPEGVFLLGVSLLQNASDVIAVVDTAAAGNYANVDADYLELPQVPLELDNPVLLTSQRVHAQPRATDSLPTNSSNLGISAELTFDYSEDGRLQSISANGCLAPSMQEMARLIGVNGYMAKLDTQWLPSASLALASAEAYENPAIDERLVFDWAGSRATFETVTSCHQAEDVQPGSSELGGVAEVSYKWRFDGGELAELIAEIPQPSGPPVTRTLVPRKEGAIAQFPGYELTRNGAPVEAVIYRGGLESCPVEDGMDADSPSHFVTDRIAYDFAGYEPQPDRFTDLYLEFDTRDGVNRPLRYGFLAPDMAGLNHVTDTGNGFEWAMYYPERTSETPVGGPPNLIERAYIKMFSPDKACPRVFEPSSSRVYAWIDYEYKSLSQYLVERLD